MNQFLILGTNSMAVPIWTLQNKSKLWSFLGFFSGVLGIACFALSSSSKYLFGEWKFFKSLLYITISLFICGLVLFAKKIKVSRSFMVKSHVVFLALMLTSFYSFFYDKAVKGKPDALGIISYAAFAFMSLCFSRKMELGFEVGIFNFFLGCLTVQLMKINLILAFVAAIFCYSLIIFRCFSDSQEIEAPGIRDGLVVRIDSANGEEPTRQGIVSGESIFGENHQQISEEENNLSSFQVETTGQDNMIRIEEQSTSTGIELNSKYPEFRRRKRERVDEMRTGELRERVLDDKTIESLFDALFKQTDTQAQPSPSVEEFSWKSIFGVNMLDIEDDNSLSFQQETTNQDSVTLESNVETVEKQSSSTWIELDPQYPRLRRRERMESETEDNCSSSGSERVEDQPPFLQACDFCKFPQLSSKRTIMDRGKPFCSVKCMEQSGFSPVTSAVHNLVRFKSLATS